MTDIHINPNARAYILPCIAGHVGADTAAVLLAETPIIPIYFYVSKHLIKPWVGGFVPNIMDHTYTKDLYILQH